MTAFQENIFLWYVGKQSHIILKQGFLTLLLQMFLLSSQNFFIFSYCTLNCTQATQCLTLACPVCILHSSYISLGWSIKVAQDSRPRRRGRKDECKGGRTTRESTYIAPTEKGVLGGKSPIMYKNAVHTIKAHFKYHYALSCLRGKI